MFGGQVERRDVRQDSSIRVYRTGRGEQGRLSKTTGANGIAAEEVFVDLSELHAAATGCDSSIQSAFCCSWQLL